MTLSEKLMMIQLELNAPKNQFNPFGKYNYRSCEDILNGLKPCLQKARAAVTITDDLVLIGERYYVKATATIWDVDTGECISNSAYAREEATNKGMDEAQITGSASSYARKYALNGLFCIDDVKDPDARNNSASNSGTKEERKQRPKAATSPTKPRNKISNTNAHSLINKCLNDGVDVRAVLSMYKVGAVEELTETKYKNIVEHWEEVKEAIFKQ